MRPLFLAIAPLLLTTLAHAQPASTQPTAEDLTTIRTRLLASIVPAAQPDIDALIAKARPHATTLRQDGTWPDINYTDTGRAKWLATEHLNRAHLLAKAARLSGEKNLATASAAALSHWIETNPQNPNWWWNDIGVPILLSETYLLLGDNAPTQSLPALDKILTRPRWPTLTGQNLIWMASNQILRGLITNDAALVSTAYFRLYDEVRITTKEGIQPDGSFHQHGAQLYSGGYGLSFSQDATRFVAYALGTRCAIPSEKLAILHTFLLEGQAWMTWGSLFDYSATGREITRAGKLATTPHWSHPPISPVGKAYSLGNVIQTFASALASIDPQTSARYQAWCDNLLDPAKPPVNTGHKHFPYSDYTVHRRPGYFATLKLYSSRIQNTEIVNGEGKLSHHLGDGNLFLYLTGSEYADIFPAWDWQRLPGTTTEIVPDLATDKSIPLASKSKESFVGGISDGTYGASTIHLGKGALTARKSTFFFDDEILCLGAGITSTTDNEVVTTLNQCHLQGEVIKSKQTGPNTWLHHANVGYVIRDNQTPILFNTPCIGRWTDINDAGSSTDVALPLFLLTLSHGQRPTNATYAYSLLPNLSVLDTNTRARRLETEILSNTPALQAVRHKSLDLTMAVFHTSATLPSPLGDITPSHPCLLLIRNSQLSAANPTNESLTLTVTIHKKPYTLNLDKGLTTTINLNPP